MDPGLDEQIQDGQIHDQDGKIQDQQQEGQVFVLEYFRVNETRVVKTLN